MSPHITGAIQLHTWHLPGHSTITQNRQAYAFGVIVRPSAFVMRVEFSLIEITVPKSKCAIMLFNKTCCVHLRSSNHVCGLCIYYGVPEDSLGLLQYYCGGLVALILSYIHHWFKRIMVHQRCTHCCGGRSVSPLPPRNQFRTGCDGSYGATTVKPY